MRRVRRWGPPALVAAALALALWPSAAGAHLERPVTEPDGSGSVPVYRTTGPYLLVCGDDPADFAGRVAAFPDALRTADLAYFDECQRDGFRNLQEAIDAAASGTRVLVLPGVYHETPSLEPLAPACYHLPAHRYPNGYQVLSHDQQKQCVHLQNLVGIFDKRNLQIEGLGATPADVVLDGAFQKLEILRADRADGVYFRNFTVERAMDNALYVLETDGFVIDHVVSRWDDAYGFLTFATDHGLYTDCESYGNGDSGIYPGGTSDINKNRGFTVPRYAIEVRNCRSWGNTVGYSGTGGDSVWVHDSEFDQNSLGVSMDSAFPNHPGLPQNHALFERNRIHDNNRSWYRYVADGTCTKAFEERGIEKGAVCPLPGPPVGVGVLVAGGNYDVFRGNWVYDNWRDGFILDWTPGFVRNDYRPGSQFDTSYNDRFAGNHLDAGPDGRSAPNGRDYWWDGFGAGNCWGAGSSDPAWLPRCGDGWPMLAEPDLGKALYNLNCVMYNRAARYIPPGCDWFGVPPRPGTLALTWGWFQPGLVIVGLVALGFLVRRRQVAPANTPVRPAAKRPGSPAQRRRKGRQPAGRR